MDDHWGYPMFFGWFWPIEPRLIPVLLVRNHGAGGSRSHLQPQASARPVSLHGWEIPKSKKIMGKRMGTYGTPENTWRFTWLGKLLNEMVDFAASHGCVFLRHGCRWGHHGHCQVVGLKTHGFPSTQYSKAAQAVKSLVQWIFPTINLDLSRISQPKFPGISHLVLLVMKWPFTVICSHGIIMKSH